MTNKFFIGKSMEKCLTASGSLTFKNNGFKLLTLNGACYLGT